MRKIMKAFAVLSVALFSGTCFAGEKASDQMVQTLMQKSGINKQLEQMPLMVQAGIDRQQQESQKLSREEVDKLKGMARIAFDPKEIRAFLGTYLKSNLSGNDIKAALGWLDSPLGRKITKLEEDASTPESHAVMEEMIPTLIEEYKDTARVVKIAKLDKATMASESSVNTALNVQMAMVSALSSASDSDRQISFEEINEYVNRTRPQVQEAVEKMVRLQFLYVYRTLTDFEIDKYTRFAESDSGKRYHAVASKGINDALVQAARKMGTRMGAKMSRI